MPYDERLAERLRSALRGQPGLTEQRMFGGLAFMVGGHLAVGAGSGGDLIVRVAHDDVPRLLAERGVRPMEMRGRPMTGWLLVSVEVIESDEDLKAWVARGVNYAASLPPKHGGGGDAERSD